MTKSASGISILVIAIVVAAAATLGSVFAATPSPEVARINGTVITLEEFNNKYRENQKYFQFKAPTKQGVLDDIIRRELGIQEAKRLNLDKKPEVIDRLNTVLYHALLDQQLAKEFEKIHVSDDEAKAFYQKNPEIRISHIFAAVRPNATAEEERQALEKIKRIEAGPLADGKSSFAEVAQRFSEGVAAPMGGDIDYQTRDKLDPNYYETAVKLKTPGKVSGIIRTQFGFHIIKLTAVRSWEDADKGQVKRQLFDEKRAQIFEKYMTQLRAKARVVTHPELLKD